MDEIEQEIVGQHTVFPISHRFKGIWKACKEITGLRKQKFEDYKRFGSVSPRIVIYPQSETRNVTVTVYDSNFCYRFRLWPSSDIQLNDFARNVQKVLDRSQIIRSVKLHKKWHNEGVKKQTADPLIDLEYLSQRSAYFESLSVVDISQAIADELNRNGRKTTKEEVESAMKQLNLSRTQRTDDVKESFPAKLLEVSRWSSNALRGYKIIYEACLTSHQGVKLINDFCAFVEKPTTILRLNGQKSPQDTIRKLRAYGVLRKIERVGHGNAARWLFHFCEEPKTESIVEPGPRKGLTPLQSVLQELRVTEQELRELLGSLPERASKVVSLRTGLNGPQMKVREIGRQLNLSHARISQLFRESINHLRRVKEGTNKSISSPTTTSKSIKRQDVTKRLEVIVQALVSRVEKVEDALSRVMTELQSTQNTLKTFKDQTPTAQPPISSTKNICDVVLEALNQEYEDLISSFTKKLEVVKRLEDLFNDQQRQKLDKLHQLFDAVGRLNYPEYDRK